MQNEAENNLKSIRKLQATSNKAYYRRFEINLGFD